jgi:hypothetical protein
MEGLRRTGIAALKNGACRQRNPSGFCNSVFCSSSPPKEEIAIAAARGVEYDVVRRDEC